MAASLDASRVDDSLRDAVQSTEIVVNLEDRINVLEERNRWERLDSGGHSLANKLRKEVHGQPVLVCSGK